MKAISPIILLGSILSTGWVLVAANPIQNLDFTKRQGHPGVGEAILCSLSDQCVSVRTPFDGTPLCTDFTGDLAFLDGQLKTAAIGDMGCNAHQNFGCSGTDLGGGIALPGTLVIDYTNINGQNVSSLINSIICTFL